MTAAVNKAEEQLQSVSTTSDAATTTCEPSGQPTEEPKLAEGGVSTANNGTQSGEEYVEVGEIVLERLARQVEYYFSTTNLAKDTYVSTLRSLNDGYVPVSIIAGFGKVKTLVPYDAVNAVTRAATEYSKLLHVVEIDTKSGKRVSAAADDGGEAGAEDGSNSPRSTLAGVGPVNGKPIPVEAIRSAPATPPAVKSVAPQVQNTVIIREVPEGTAESHVRELFTFDKCPPIKSLHLDVANCWFVVLDTESREDMVSVMFELRAKTFSGGEPVLARLKSGVVMNSDSLSTGGYVSGIMYPPQAPSPPRFSNGGRKNKKKKNNSKSRGNGNNQNKNSSRGKNSSSNNNRRNNGGKQKKSSGGQDRPQPKPDGRSRQSGSKQSPPTHVLPPTLGEEQFPALPSDEHLVNSGKIEVEKVPEQHPEDDYSYDDMEKNRMSSDSSSTAETSTSSSSSKQTPTQQSIGGYAAALLKAAPPKPVQQQQRAEKDVAPEPKQQEASKGKEAGKKPNKQTEKARKSTNNAKESKSKKPSEQEGEEDISEEMLPVDVTPPSWGRGRSFADVLRKEAAAAVAATPEQS